MVECSERQPIEQGKAAILQMGILKTTAQAAQVATKTAQVDTQAAMAREATVVVVTARTRGRTKIAQGKLANAGEEGRKKLTRATSQLERSLASQLDQKAHMFLAVTMLVDQAQMENLF